MESFYHVPRRHPNRGDEERGAGVDDDRYQLVELTLGVVVIGLACVAAYLRQEEIHTERSRFVMQIGFELLNLFAELFLKVIMSEMDVGGGRKEKERRTGV